MTSRTQNMEHQLKKNILHSERFLATETEKSFVVSEQCLNMVSGFHGSYPGNKGCRA